MRNLDCFFRPSSVAVVGASRNAKKFGHVILKNFMTSGFRGKIYPVNPKADEIFGLKCHKCVADVPEPVDLAVIVVPAELVADVIEDCGRKGVKGAIVISGGFAESGFPEREEALKAAAKKHGIRLIGPNCIGVFDPASGVDTIFNPAYKLNRPSPGPIAFVSQSGAFGAAVLDWANSESIGISKFVSYGNGADVDEVETLDYLGKDDATKAVAVYLEGTRDGRKLLRVAREVIRKTPVVVLKAGKTKQGAAAVASHTGSLAGSAAVYSAAFRQAGIVEAQTMDELFDFTRCLAYQQPTAGDRIAVVTNGGGFGVVAADTMESEGLTPASFSANTAKAIRENMPSYVSLGNPLDIVGDADAERYRVALDAVCRDKGVDGVVVTMLLQTSTLESNVVDVITEAAEEYKKPMVVCAAGGDYTRVHLRVLERAGVPAYPTPERAVKAMAVLVRYGAVKRRNADYGKDAG